MFPLHTRTFPASAIELERLLNESLQHVLVTQADPVRVSGREYPRLDEIDVGLDGAQLRPDPAPPRMIAGPQSPALQVNRLRLHAHGLCVGPATINLKLDARDVRLHQGKDAQAEIVLALNSAAEGSVEISTTKAGLERAIEEVAKREASKHGVTIEGVRLDLRQAGKRGLEGGVKFRARKMFFAAVVQITASLAIDDELNAAASNLHCSGEGAIGSLACGLLAPHLEKLEGRAFPLMTLSLGEVRLRDVQLSVGDELSVAAEF